jgi:hypothetical protein
MSTISTTSSNAKIGKVTQSRLKALLEYNELTGDFTWRSGQHKGKIAGTFIKKTGYIMIGIDKKKYPAHHLAWLYTEGYFPLGYDVDHKDRIRHNNARKNLRLLSRSCNIKNTKKRSDNSLGVTGVAPKGNRYQAYITDSKGKRIHLGSFILYSDAVLARWEAEIKFRYPDCKSSSSAFKYLQECGLI